jgi:CheY-like chemotaxis protein
MDRQFTLLLVEDDPEIREATSALLREDGFRVLAADDGYEAIRVLVDHQVDLLFTDIAMPGISGVQLARQAQLMRRSSRPLHNGRRRASVRQWHPLRQGSPESLPEPTKSWPRPRGL